MDRGLWSTGHVPRPSSQRSAGQHGPHCLGLLSVELARQSESVLQSCAPGDLQESAWWRGGSVSHTAPTPQPQKLELASPYLGQEAEEEEGQEAGGWYVPHATVPHGASRELGRQNL